MYQPYPKKYLLYFGYFDYQNNRQKGFSVGDSIAHAGDMMLFGITDFGKGSDQLDEVACTARPGDLLAHHALTIHRAEANSSATRNRRALGFIFYAKCAHENVVAHKAYQSKLATEMADAGKI